MAMSPLMEIHYVIVGVGAVASLAATVAGVFGYKSSRTLKKFELLSMEFNGKNDGDADAKRPPVVPPAD